MYFHEIFEWTAGLYQRSGETICFFFKILYWAAGLYLSQICETKTITFVKGSSWGAAPPRPPFGGFAAHHPFGGFAARVSGDELEQVRE